MEKELLKISGRFPTLVPKYIPIEDRAGYLLPDLCIPLRKILKE
jgi:hypothetical protein